MSSISNNRTNRNVATYKLVLANFSTSGNQVFPYFGFPTYNGTQFNLYLQSTSSNPWGHTFASIYIHLSYCNQATLKAKHRMWIVNAKGNKSYIQEGISIFRKGKFNAAYSVPRDVLLDPINGLLVYDTLRIVCEIELVHEGEALHAKPEASYEFSAISQHYGSLLESGKRNDVVLAIGKKEFRAHKLVLSARSPVFAAMFDHSDMKEAQQGRVKIVDIAVEVFELFLRYLYTDNIDQLDRFAPELLAVADMYQMDCLKSLCEHFLCSTLTIKNVSEMLIHADLYRAEALKTKCIDYITDNSEQVRTTEGWKVLYKKADLLGLLFDNLSIKHILLIQISTLYYSCLSSNSL